MKKEDFISMILLFVALAQALYLAQPAMGGLLPLLKPGAAPGALQGPGAVEAGLRSQTAWVGDYVNIEDLVRGTLALEQGKLTGVAPLSDAERQALSTVMAQADQHRQELLSVESQIAAKEAELSENARQMAQQLSPEQRAWILAERDRVSVGGIEAGYWAELIKVMGP